MKIAKRKINKTQRERDRKRVEEWERECSNACKVENVKERPMKSVTAEICKGNCKGAD